MSHDLDVFVAADQSLPEFLQELEELLGIRFVAYFTGTDRWYDATVDGVSLHVSKNKFASDEDLPLGHYNYDISLRGILEFSVERERRLYEYANFVFVTLKNKHRYKLMLLDDMQLILDEVSVNDVV